MLPFTRHLKLSDLDGEQMHMFRTGAELYPYCQDCVHSAYTPITQVLGCTTGDDPKVMEYSRKEQRGEVSEEIEKCPGFLDRDTGTPGAVAPLIVSAELETTSDIRKDFPGELTPHNPVDWYGVAENAVEQLPEEAEQQKRIIDNALKALEWEQERVSSYPFDQDWDYSGHAVNVTTGYVRMDTHPPTDLGQQKNFYSALADAGLNAQTPDEQAYDIISHVMERWDNGALIPVLDENSVSQVWQEFKQVA